MRELTKIRKQIDEIDAALVELFHQRMQLSAEVADYKRTTKKPIYDPQREDAKIQQLKKQSSDPFLNKAIEEIFRQLMSISRRYQYSLLSEEKQFAIGREFEQVEQLDIHPGTMVVYQGAPGAYQEQAMIQFFGENINHFTVREFKDVVKAVSEGKADYGILPIENTSAGTVSGIYDLLLDSDVCVVGEEIVQCDHALLGMPGTDLSKISKVYSHPQGLLQCKKFIEDHQWETVSMLNTAVSAKKVAQDQDPAKAAIASERAAKLYGLEVLRKKINFEGNNCTRFVVMSKKKQYKKDADKISISFSLPHATGTLYNILAHFMFNDVNMCNIESRPLPMKQWEYGFYIDVEGNLQDSSIKNALTGIKEEVKDFKMLGNF